MKIWHPYTQEAVEPTPVQITHGSGAYLYTREGRRLVDAISSWWVNLHGHAHPLIAEAIAAQARKLEHVIFAGFTHDAAEELSARLGRLLPATLDRVFYSDNGSTAVEVALKIAVQYWYNKGRKEKCGIVALANAYHGDTIGAMSVSADSAFTAAFDALRLPVFRISTTGDLEKLLNDKKDAIAAMIAEPLVQGAGGMITHSTEYLQRLRQLCADNEILFIADEVFTGFGRTGEMFACDRAKIVPDLICLSKGLTGGFMPLAATVCSQKVFEAFYSQDRSRTFFHGHSYSGNPLGCAAGIASLKIFETEPVFERIAGIERIHRERLTEFRNHPAVENVRMLGTIAAIELRATDRGYLSDIRNRLYPFFIENGVLLRPLGNVIYAVPPYVISADDLHYVYDVIRKTISKLEDWSIHRLS
jgi:adenosylmethionine-8-amino-7-oxononanoate aminotransferase